MKLQIQLVIRKRRLLEFDYIPCLDAMLQKYDKSHGMSRGTGVRLPTVRDKAVWHLRLEMGSEVISCFICPRSPGLKKGDTSVVWSYFGMLPLWIGEGREGGWFVTTAVSCLKDLPMNKFNCNSRF